MNQKYPHPILAREGWPYIGGTFLLALLWTALAGFGFVAALLWIFFIIVTQFFRLCRRQSYRLLTDRL